MHYSIELLICPRTHHNIISCLYILWEGYSVSHLWFSYPLDKSHFIELPHILIIWLTRSNHKTNCILWPGQVTEEWLWDWVSHYIGDRTLSPDCHKGQYDASMSLHEMTVIVIYVVIRDTAIFCTLHVETWSNKTTLKITHLQPRTALKTTHHSPSLLQRQLNNHGCLHNNVTRDYNLNITSPTGIHMFSPLLISICNKRSTRRCRLLFFLSKESHNICYCIGQSS